MEPKIFNFVDMLELELCQQPLKNIFLHVFMNKMFYESVHVVKPLREKRREYG